MSGHQSPFSMVRLRVDGHTSGRAKEGEREGGERDGESERE
jgi:hypothetical protein